MSGNVWEWCQDVWHENYKGAPDDGSAWEQDRGGYRVYRGGSWGSHPCYCLAASRDRSEPTLRNGYLGFRLALQ